MLLLTVLVTVLATCSAPDDNAVVTGPALDGHPLLDLEWSRLAEPSQIPVGSDRLLPFEQLASTKSLWGAAFISVYRGNRPARCAAT